jgi:hypothetical protein
MTGRRRALALLAGALLAPALPCAAGAATWAFEPPPDRFSAEALLDLRSLNEAVAGEHGFVRTDGRGGFVRGDGQPIRFWAVNSEVGLRPFVATPLGLRQAPDLARHARFLAKRGVNLVRLHRQVGDDPAVRDAIWRAVAAYRREGIYVALSPYWAATADPASPPWGELFFDAERQRAYRAALRALLVPPNPYTGVPLAREPALALLQLQNEDSLLFWTVDRIAGAARQRLQAEHAEFLARRGRDASWAALRPMGELTRPARGEEAARLADQTEFLARTMREFNAQTVRWLRDEIGLRALVNAGNWKTASAAHLGDAERWSYLPGDVDAVNVYTAGVHRGANAGWAIAAGDRHADSSVLDRPQQLPLQVKQSVGPQGVRPMWISEGHWTPPNAWAAEGPWIAAVFGAAYGLAGYAWFTTADEGFSAPRSANGHLPSLAKWNVATPEVLGSFPATALLFRRALVPRTAPAAVERRTTDGLWQRRVPRWVEPQGFDPNRDADPPPDAATADPWPGPVWTVFDDATPPPLPNASAAPAWQVDRRGRALRVDAPAAQGVVAFFETSPRHRTRDLEIRAENRYGALLAVALDDAPLRTSRRVLIQYATGSRPTGWRDTAKPDGLRRIDDVGRAPWQVEAARLSLALHNAALRRARVLDMNLEARGEVPLERDGAVLRLRFPPAAMYLLLD